jgi:hypothetical protein
MTFGQDNVHDAGRFFSELCGELCGSMSLAVRRGRSPKPIGITFINLALLLYIDVSRFRDDDA